MIVELKKKMREHLQLGRGNPLKLSGLEFEWSFASSSSSAASLISSNGYTHAIHEDTFTGLLFTCGTTQSAARRKPRCACN